MSDSFGVLQVDASVAPTIRRIITEKTQNAEQEKNIIVAFFARPSFVQLLQQPSQQPPHILTETD